MTSALFLDRDGIINEDRNYVFRPEDFNFIDGIFDLCHAAMQSQFAIIVLTNQAGIARGLYTEADFNQLTEWMICRFEEQGIAIRKVYYSPFHPTCGIGKYRKDAFCRKPNPGMILAARDEFGLDLRLSILVGDKLTDIEAGSRAGVRLNVLVTSEKVDSEITAVQRLQDVIPYLVRNL